jgi:hypothetical protein
MEQSWSQYDSNVRNNSVRIKGQHCIIHRMH